jgi:serine/threonine protein kinase
MSEHKFGRYEIEAKLRDDPQAVVYKARDPMINRYVAVRTLLKPEGMPDEEFVQRRTRFFSELQKAGKLMHPCIAAIFDVGTDERTGEPFVTTEFVAGTPLCTYLDEKHPLPPDEALNIAKQLADSFHYAHSLGIVHRDPKPENIFVLRNGLTKVLDFGIPTFFDSPMTDSGEMLIDPQFASPEQLNGREPDVRSNIFSLGALFYYLVTGVRPFAAPDAGAAVMKVLNFHPKPPTSLRPEISASWDEIVMRAIRKAPADRFQNGKEILEILSRMEGRAAAVEMEELQEDREASIEEAEAESAGLDLEVGDIRLSDMPHGKVKVRIIEGPEKGKIFELFRPITIIGRRKSDINVHDKLISSKHCSITLAEGKLYLRDLASLNGTVVNGRKIREIELRPGIVVSMGRTKFVAELEHEEGPGSWAPPSTGPESGLPGGPEEMPPPEKLEAAKPAEVEEPPPAERMEREERRFPLKPERILELEFSDRSPAGREQSPGAMHPTTVERPPTKPEKPLADWETTTDVKFDPRKTMVDIKLEDGARQSRKSALLGVEYTLEVVEGVEQGRIYQLQDGKTVVGRGGYGVQVEDQKVSRKHAEIEIRGSKHMFLKDLASKNGTFLNDTPISHSQLRDEDIIRVGDTRLKFRARSTA